MIILKKIVLMMVFVLGLIGCTQPTFDDSNQQPVDTISGEDIGLTSDEDIDAQDLGSDIAEVESIDQDLSELESLEQDLENLI
ncbi:hypothetical protein CEE44_00030 [Candidatus Woesearchaeota archaeon B3_Woes]|nr:MAG: hypothetical protein CEE44_00030 [Candidatus Woesearchaeota archaeon B3_Woes]